MTSFQFYAHYFVTNVTVTELSPSHPAMTVVADCQPRLSAIYAIAGTANYATIFEPTVWHK